MVLNISTAVCYWLVGIQYVLHVEWLQYMSYIKGVGFIIYYQCSIIMVHKSGTRYTVLPDALQYTTRDSYINQDVPVGQMGEGQTESHVRGWQVCHDPFNQK